MDKAVFLKRLQAIYDDPDIEHNHSAADYLLIEALESEGYDLTLYKKSTRWYA